VLLPCSLVAFSKLVCAENGIQDDDETDKDGILDNLSF